MGWAVRSIVSGPAKGVSGCKNRNFIGNSCSPRTALKQECRQVEIAFLHSTAIDQKRVKGKQVLEEQDDLFGDDAPSSEQADDLFGGLSAEAAPIESHSSLSGTNSEKFETLYNHLSQATSPGHPDHLKPRRSKINNLIAVTETQEQFARLLTILRQWHRKQYGYTGLVSEHLNGLRSDFSRGSTWRLLQGRAIKVGALESAWQVLSDLADFGIRPGSSRDVVPLVSALAASITKPITGDEENAASDTLQLTTQRVLLVPAILQALNIYDLHPKITENILKVISELKPELRGSPFVTEVHKELTQNANMASAATAATHVSVSPRSGNVAQVRTFSTSSRLYPPRVSAPAFSVPDPGQEAIATQPSANLEGSTTLASQDSHSTAPKDANPGYFKVTQTRSATGLKADLQANLFSLGLRHRLQTVYRPHNQVEAGKILKVKELVRVENVTAEQAAEGAASFGAAARGVRRNMEKGWTVVGSHRSTPTRATYERVTGIDTKSFSTYSARSAPTDMRGRTYFATLCTKVRPKFELTQQTGVSRVFARNAGFFGRLVQGLLSRENRAKQEEIRPQASSSIFNEIEGRKMGAEDETAQALPSGQAYSARPATSHHYRTGNFKGSPQKLGLLAKQISGKHIQDAIEQMQFSAKRKRAHKVRAMLCTARDHAVGYKRMDPARLYIAQAWVGKGLYLKRLEIKGRARTGIRVHPSAHLAVELRLRPTVAEALAKEKRLLLKKKVRMTIIEDKPIYSPKPYYNW